MSRTEVIVRGAPPWLLTVIVCGGEEVSTVTDPKLNGAGVTEMSGSKHAGSFPSVRLLQLLSIVSVQISVAPGLIAVTESLQSVLSRT